MSESKAEIGGAGESAKETGWRGGAWGGVGGGSSVEEPELPVTWTIAVLWTSVVQLQTVTLTQRKELVIITCRDSHASFRIQRHEFSQDIQY